MAQSQEKLEIEDYVILKACEESSQYGQALYFAQRCYYSEGNTINNIENMIRLSTHLGLTKTVKGLALLVKNKEMTADGYEKLGQWEQAKTHYLSDTDQSVKGENYMGLLRCLKHQKKWDEISSLADKFEDLSPVVKKEVSPILSAAFFHRQMWSKIGPLIDYFPHSNYLSYLVWLVSH